MTRSTPILSAFSASRARAAGLKRGFTLVEVMVAIAIALALIVGISQIFAMAQKTTGGGTTLVKMNGTERSIQSQLRQDFQGINIDSATSPGLVITSYSAAAFRNKQDQLESRDTSLPPDPRLFNNPDFSTGPTYPANGPMSLPYVTNAHIHRLDRLCMFVRNTFHRQTANSPNLTSQTSTQEGFVWYGHLAQLNDAGIANWDPTNPQMASSANVPANALQMFMNPGAPSLAGGPKNDNNEFASQWVLGREAILLSAVDTGECMYRPITTNPNPATWFVPLSLLDTSLTSSIGTSVGTQALKTSLFSSRYDISLSTSQNCHDQYQTIPAASIPWYQQVSGLQFLEGTPTIIRDQRYDANVFPTKNPATLATNPGLWLSGAAAQTSPAFVRGCSQFIVEYAGDYVSQNQDSSPGNPNFGQVNLVATTSNGGDGTVDFIPIRDHNGNWTRQIRWYGFPRDTTALDPFNKDALLHTIPNPGPDGFISDLSSQAGITQAVTFDVVPLSTFLAAAGVTGAAAAPVFEKNFGVFPTSINGLNGGNFAFNNIGYANNKNMPEVSIPYVCAWDSTTPANLLPKMIRITIAIDDPNGRLNTEQTFEYIFALPN